MEKYRVEISEPAENDLLATVHYISMQLSAPIAAAQIVDAFDVVPEEGSQGSACQVNKQENLSLPRRNYNEDESLSGGSTMKANPLYTITVEAADYLTKIAEAVTRLEYGTEFKFNTGLHRENRLRTIHSSLAIEGNSLSLGEVGS